MVPEPSAHPPTFSRRALIEAASLGAAHLAGLGASSAHAATAAPTADVPTLVAANTAFALMLYSQIRPTARNLVFSPYSVSQALAMVYAGARGRTAAQMASVLGFAPSPSDVNGAFAVLDADLASRGNARADPDRGQLARQLRIADALWGEQTYPFNTAYEAELARAYGAGLQLVDFKHAAEAARAKINAWVAAQTNNRIQDIVPPGAITSGTLLALANAIWFDGGWADPFDLRQTSDDQFHRLDGSAVTTPFMVQWTSLPYARRDGFQAVELAYAGSGFAFTVILPDTGKFAAIETGLTPTMLAPALIALRSTDVILHLPKFTFTVRMNLSQTLSAMGMIDAFDYDLADLHGMSDLAALATRTPPDPPLRLSGVLHKAFVGVDEKHTEAAAATVGIGTPAAASAMASPPPRIVVRVDRPFLFAIRDTVSGTLLFLGRVLDPSA